MNLMTALRQENLDSNNIMKANKRTEDSCNESDEHHSSKQNLDLNNNKYQRELQKRIIKRIQILPLNLINRGLEQVKSRFE